MRHDVTAIEIVWQNPWVRALAYVVGLAFVIYVLWALRGGYAFALQVAIIGFLIAYILNPAVDAMSRLKIGRALSVILVYLVLLQLVVLGSVLVTQVVAEIDRLVRLLPSAIQNIFPLLEQSGEWLGAWRENLPDFLRERLGVDTAEENTTLALIEENVTAFLAAQAEQLSATVRNFVANAGNYLLVGVTGILSTTFQLFMILLASAYFLYDFPRITANVQRYVPLRWRPVYRDLTRKADRTVGGFLRGQLLITSILGVLIYIGLSIIGVPLALAISFLAAVFNLVPYLGPIVGTIPAVLLGFTVSPLTALLAVVVFVIANQIEAHLLAPLILSKSTSLHPVTVLISILAGAGLLGLLGVLLAVPIVAFAKVILEEYLLKQPPYREEALAVASSTSTTAEPPAPETGKERSPGD
jgi:predicted PurR-regulated permease PerM